MKKYNLYLTNKLMENKDAFEEKFGKLNIDNILIEQDNIIDVINFKENNLHCLRSASKLITAIAMGIAIDKKMKFNGSKISLDSKVYPILKDIVNFTNKSNKMKVEKWTIKNLLTHTTGYKEQMFDKSFLKNISEDKYLDYAINYDIPYEVGKRYAYNNVEPFIISVIFSEALNVKLSEFVKENLFNKMEIKEFKWDDSGKYTAGGTGLYLKPYDFHKIGKLLMNDGMYNGVQIISKNWCYEMIKKQVDTESAYKPERVFPKIAGGYYTFISRDGFVFRDGAEGQYIIINKSKNLQITIMSAEKNMKNVTEIFRGII